MNKKIIGTAIALVAAAPLAVSAGPSYDYVEVGYLNVNLDNGPTADGFGLGGSFAINENFHVVGSWAQVSKSPVTISELSVGLGYNLGLSDTADFVGRIGGVRGRVKISGLGSASDNGFFAQAGFRNMFTNQFELNGFLTYVDAGGSETSLDFGGVYHFNNQFAGTLGASFSEDATAWSIGVRFSF